MGGADVTRLCAVLCPSRATYWRLTCRPSCPGSRSTAYPIQQLGVVRRTRQCIVGVEYSKYECRARRVGGSGLAGHYCFEASAEAMEVATIMLAAMGFLYTLSWKKPLLWSCVLDLSLLGSCILHRPVVFRISSSSALSTDVHWPCPNAPIIAATVCLLLRVSGTTQSPHMAGSQDFLTNMYLAVDWNAQYLLSIYWLSISKCYWALLNSRYTVG